MKMADLGCVELRLGLKCDGCGEVVPINGPRRVAQCLGCEKSHALEGALAWSALLNFQTPPTDVFKHAATQKDGAVQEGARPRVTLSSTRAWPKCACGRRFEATKLAGVVANVGSSIACPTCAAELKVDRPPKSFRAIVPAAVAVVGAETIPDVQSSNNPTRPRNSPKVVTVWWALFDRSLA